MRSAVFFLLAGSCTSFQIPASFSTRYSLTSSSTYRTTISSSLASSSTSDVGDDATNEAISTTMKEMENAKADLVSMCSGSTKPSLSDVQGKVKELEDLAELVGIGQASASSGLLSGEWELVYSPEDMTRSSPFFWAFRRAFPENSDQIFAITDAIPAPIKEVGPAFQEIDMEQKTLVSRVKVATLGGQATSIMTTRADIERTEGLDGILLKIKSTKPEDSTVLKKLGPLGSFINENSMPFPSGEALEKVQPGSSQVLMVTTFCDEGLRISRNDDNIQEVYVWKRKSMGKTFEI